jgi:hypothetical protein
LGNLDSVLQTKKKLLSKEMDYWRGAAMISRLLKKEMKLSEKNEGERNNFVENRKQYVEMAWTRIRYGCNRWPKRILTWSPGRR